MPKKISDDRFEVHFWSRVDKSGGPNSCWPWTGALNGEGRYGFFRRKGKNHYAHRQAFQFAFGPIDSGLHICHKCDNPPCCNPEHLFSGTPRDNVRDAMEKGRHVPPPRIIPPKTKLNPDFVREIRSLIASGATQLEAAKRYGVAESTIGHIARGTTWAWVR